MKRKRKEKGEGQKIRKEIRRRRGRREKARGTRRSEEEFK